MGSRPPDRTPGAISPRDAVRRFLNARKPESTSQSIESYWTRLKPWIQWCQAQRIEHVGELSGWDFDEYKNARSGDGIATITLYGEFHTLRQLTKYLVSVDAVDSDLPEKVGEMIPVVPDGEDSNDVMLEPADALAQLRHYRSSPQRASLLHTFLEIAWFTGARRAGIQGLDVQDFDYDDCILDFRHRPETETTLKKGSKGERPVAIPQRVADIIQEYIEENRWDRHDEHGRQPLLTSMQGRPTETTITVWGYKATFPCIRTSCPHGKEPETCDFKCHSKASKCPSTRSPHRIRTGSITWQHDIGFPPEVVAERVNSSPETIKKHYDKASRREKLERRRRPFVDQMDLRTSDSSGSE